MYNFFLTDSLLKKEKPNILRFNVTILNADSDAIQNMITMSFKENLYASSGTTSN